MGMTLRGLKCIEGYIIDSNINCKVGRQQIKLNKVSYNKQGYDIIDRVTVETITHTKTVSISLSKVQKKDK